jgi:purine-binding chemotaxis protein CheW
MTRQFCTFFLGDLYCGIEVRQVQEVLRYQRMTRVPLAPPVVRGLINLRGQIVPALDLRRRLDLAERPAGHQPMNVIVRVGDEAVSLLVDEIGDVLEIPGEWFERPPETIRGPARDLIRGVFKLDARLMLLLDTEKVLAITP